MRRGRPVLAHMGIALLLLVGTSGCAESLLNAAADGNTQVVVALLQKGVDANEPFPLVKTSALILASGEGNRDTVRALLDAGADVNAADLTGWTALHAGAFNGDPEIVSLLLERGAIPVKSRWFLSSPAEIAEKLNHKDVLPLLRQAEGQTADNNSVF